MDKYIKESELFKRILNVDFKHDYDGCIKFCQSMPAADVVEVVRCKDCKRRYVGGYTTQYYVCDFMDAELKDEGYCSYGERKDG